ncbi:Maf family nucleotide pyrophosphatase [Winogradskyella aurantia]|uniref:dTTP/UTP pyrophosphatase n=1 Tax=Winogradskyella aurantia TaxID=1915063 RepID=A0A265UWT9_9FLAO|nr:Maf family nucleotide pyrophosphatase [Winogradskyella aurantia]OZV69769.1 septum formation protein Maf [Winogradskyella aurantia]
MLHNRLKAYNLILASASPRRHEFLRSMLLDFEIKVPDVEEVYPEHLSKEAITDYLARLKAASLKNALGPKDILITSDTIVWHKDRAIEKPKNDLDAFNMIKTLSGDTHEVITSICITTIKTQITKNTITKVTFRNLEDEEIKFYVDKYQPLDKAGAYGIQEWIGAVGITKIEGSYNNVVGLPTHLLYETLNAIA